MLRSTGYARTNSDDVQIRLELVGTQRVVPSLDLNEGGPRALSTRHANEPVRPNLPIAQLERHLDEAVQRPNRRSKLSRDRSAELVDRGKHCEQRGCAASLLLLGTSDTDVGISRAACQDSSAMVDPPSLGGGTLDIPAARVRKTHAWSSVGVTSARSRHRGNRDPPGDFPLPPMPRRCRG
jgi:hypothetical protein